MPRPSLPYYLLWVAAFAGWAWIAWQPLSNSLTRLLSLALIFTMWSGLIWLCTPWRAARYVVLLASFGALLLLLGPARARDVARLRADYAKALPRYLGAPYVWGGESPEGIDCSGLVRRGLIDALFLRGVESANPGLVRQSLIMWWHDCTAAELGTGATGLTRLIGSSYALNDEEPSQLQLGDLAVSGSGLHVMAYLGDRRWIEADPARMQVLIIQAPALGNAGFDMPMTITRWKALEP